MIKAGSLVRLIRDSNEAGLWKGKLLTVHERMNDTLVVWADPKGNQRYKTVEINVNEVEEVC